MNSESSESVETSEPPRRRRWLRRLAAVAFGLLVVVAAESTCRVLGWGDPRLREDPFVGFAGTRPLFILNDAGTKYVVPRVRHEYFARESFPASKPDGTRRIFCLGGSTVQGRPWSIPTAFSTWLELSLNVLDEMHDWDVINCGGISYASYRLVPILEECLQYEPDLIILCTGHNEFLEDRTYQDVSRSPLMHRASRLRLVNIARSWIHPDERPADRETSEEPLTILPLETEPILNFNGGLAAYHRDEEWLAGVAQHFEVNVRRMVQIAQAARVPILLMRPASNLRDCPPFKSEHRSGMSPDELQQWGELISLARQARETDPSRALELMEQAVAFDSEFALSHFQLGRLYLSMRDEPTARESFVRARDLDICPLRMTSELERRLAMIVEEQRLPYVDIHALLESRTGDGILGDDVLVDHVHPTLEGHQAIAAAIVESLTAMNMLDPSTEMAAAIRSAYESHLQTLESAYFLRGQRMLHGLREWSQGRADGPPAVERYPARFPEGQAPD